MTVRGLPPRSSSAGLCGSGSQRGSSGSFPPPLLPGAEAVVPPHPPLLPPPLPGEGVEASQAPPLPRGAGRGAGTEPSLTGGGEYRWSPAAWPAAAPPQPPGRHLLASPRGCAGTGLLPPGRVAARHPLSQAGVLGEDGGWAPVPAEPPGGGRRWRLSGCSSSVSLLPQPPERRRDSAGRAGGVPVTCDTPPRGGTHGTRWSCVGVGVRGCGGSAVSRPWVDF